MTAAASAVAAVDLDRIDGACEQSIGLVIQELRGVLALLLASDG